MTAQPADEIPTNGPDTGSYEVIHAGGQAAVVVPVSDFLRLRALEQAASAQELEDAEDQAAGFLHDDPDRVREMLDAVARLVDAQREEIASPGSQIWPICVVSANPAVAGLAADIEPQVAREGQEALQGLAVEFGGVLSGVRGDVAEPAGLVSGVGQLPQFRSNRLEVVQEPMQVLGQFGAVLDARAGSQQPCR